MKSQPRNLVTLAVAGAVTAISGAVALAAYTHVVQIWALPGIVASHSQNIKDLQER